MCVLYVSLYIIQCEAPHRVLLSIFPCRYWKLIWKYSLYWNVLPISLWLVFDTQTFTVQNYVCLAGIFNKMAVCRPVFGMHNIVPKGKISHSDIRTAAHLLVRYSHRCYQFNAPKVPTPWVESREEDQFWLRSVAVSSSPLNQWQSTEICWRSLIHFQ